MDGSVRSGGVIKKKSSSGCLIIKKKVDSSNSGGRVGGLSVNNEERKRPRLVESDSDSSDEDESLEFMRRKVNDRRLHNGSMGHKRSELGSKEYHRNNVGIEIGGERKRSRLDLYDFDEYDEFDGNQMRGEYVEDRYRMVGRPGGRNLQEFGVGSSGRNLVVDKRKQSSYHDGSSSGRNKGIEYSGARRKGSELEEDEAHMPISLLRLKYQETANEPIRVQGKNGVLKVMVNNKKKMDSSSQHKNVGPCEIEEKKVARFKDVQGKDFSARTPVNPTGLKQPEKRGLYVDKGKAVVKEKNEVNLEKVKFSGKGNKAKEIEKDADTSLKLAPPSIQVYSSKKAVKRLEEASAPPENVTPVKGKEGKAKRGGSTEKQILREKIRGMLVDAGWTIDYRPRRNRDYLDAVYINPSGTAYWSIIKAYDAFKKHLEEDNDKTNLDLGSPSVAPLSDDLINKLTRQTKKKIEAEMKRKRKEAGMTKSAKKSAAREAADSSDSDQDEERLGSFKKQNYKSQKRNLNEDQESEDGSSDDSPKRKRKIRVEKTANASNSNVVQGRTSKKIGRCTLLVRGTDRGDNSESDGYVPYSGKRTVLAWLIDSGTAQLSEKVQYMNRKRTKALLEGWMTRDGIHCGCCSKILTVSKFELHAGSKLRQPFQNIFLESGASLLQCQIDAWNRQDESVRQDSHTVDVDGDDPDDDTCGICGDGGDLICCDSCPSTFHQICLGIQMLPSGDWHCPNCTCKFCGDANGTVAEENDSTADELIRCSFCEKKYHKSCSEMDYMTSNGASFCGLECQELYDHVQKILGVKHELEAGFSWSLNQRTDVSDTSLRGFHQRVECNSKLAVALSVLDECFLPINDRRSGINMIRNVVYNCGSNFNRLNYRGFYTAILERGDEIISAASIRIHGTRLAEMPFIGTREIYRRQGMCRRLFSAIETELCSLKVRQLIIPAISEHMNTWTTVFGFRRLEDTLKKEIKSRSMLVFPGTDMLQKQLVKQEISDGLEVPTSIKDQPEMCALVKKSENDSSVGHDRQVNEDSKPCHEIKTKNSKRAIPIKLEVENIEKEDSGSLKCPPSPSEGNNTRDMENGLPNPIAGDNTKPSEEVVMEDGCKLESPFVKPVCDSSSKTLDATDDTGNHHSPVLEITECASVVGNEGSLINMSEHAAPQVIVDVTLESPPASVVETPAKSTTDEVSAELAAALPIAEDNTKPSEEVDMEDGSKPESPSVEPVCDSSSKTLDATDYTGDHHSPVLEIAECASVVGNEGSRIKMSEDVAPQVIVDVTLESPPDPVIETPAKSTTDEVCAEIAAALPIAENNTKPSEEVVREDGCKLESPCVEPVCDSSSKTLDATDDKGNHHSPILEITECASVVDNEDSPIKMSEEVAPQVIVDVTLESPPASVVETPVKSTTDEVSVELAAAVPTPAENEEPVVQLVLGMSQPTETVVERELNSSIEPSPDSPEVLPNDSIEAMNVNQDAASLLPTSPDTERDSKTNDAEVGQKAVVHVENGLAVQGISDLAKTDEPNGETKLSSLDDGKGFSPITSSEVSAHNTETAEIHAESTDCPDNNGAQP